MNLRRLHRSISESLADYLSDKLGEQAPPAEDLAGELGVLLEEALALELHRSHQIEARRLRLQQQRDWRCLSKCLPY